MISTRMPDFGGTLRTVFSPSFPSMMSFRGDSKMKNHNQRFRSALAPRVLLAAAIVLFSCAFGTKVFADPEFEHSKIVYLLDAIGSSDLEFIRNGVEYTGKEA